jgi:hypothetical protein
MAGKFLNILFGCRKNPFRLECTRLKAGIISDISLYTFSSTVSIGHITNKARLAEVPPTARNGNSKVMVFINTATGQIAS